MLCGGDLGGPVVQDLALRFPELADRMCLFNSPLPYDKERMAGFAHAAARSRRATTSSARAPTPTGWPPTSPRPSSGAATSPPSTRPASGPTPGALRRAHGQVDFHTEPFGDAAHLRASFGAYRACSTRPR